MKYSIVFGVCFVAWLVAVVMLPPPPSHAADDACTDLEPQVIDLQQTVVAMEGRIQELEAELIRQRGD